MFLKLLQNTEKIFWTKHSKEKMRYYNLSEKRVLRILRKPERKEEGLAPKTIAAMQITGTKKHPTEVWMMYQVINPKSDHSPFSTGWVAQPLFKGCGEIRNPKIKIISAWRYPGRTLEGERPIIPEDTLEELENILKRR